MGAGRPSDYEPDYCPMLITHMDDGLSFESFGGVIGVGRATLYRWVDEHEEFRDAKNVGTEKGRLYWEKLGREGLHAQTIKSEDGMVITKAINSAIYIFTMKNRFQWRDKQPDEDPPPGGEQGKTVVLTPEQVIELMKVARGDKK